MWGTYNGKVRFWYMCCHWRLLEVLQMFREFLTNGLHVDWQCTMMRHWTYSCEVHASQHAHDLYYFSHAALKEGTCMAINYCSKAIAQHVKHYCLLIARTRCMTASNLVTLGFFFLFSFLLLLGFKSSVWFFRNDKGCYSHSYHNVNHKH